VNALRLAALLSVSAASFAGGRLAQPALYEPLTSASLPRVTVHPSGECLTGATAGVTAGTCWMTEAPWEVASTDGVLPALRDTHRSATNAATVLQVQGLIEQVGLPASRAVMAAVLATGVFADPVITDVEWAGFVLRPGGARLAQPAALPALEMRVTLRSMVVGVPPITRIVQVPGPHNVVAGVDADGGTTYAPAPGTLAPAAVAAALALIDAHVPAAIRAETGLR